MSEVSHEQIYERLVAVEQKVDRIDTNTQGLVEAIDAAQGAVPRLPLRHCQRIRLRILWRVR